MKNVVITGGADGLGFELVKRYLKASQVFALDRNLLPQILELDGSNENLCVYECDITSSVSVKKAFDGIRRKCNRIDRLFNNAGVIDFNEWVTLDKTNLDSISGMVDVNAVGCLRVVKEAIPLIGEGTVLIYTSSEAGSIGNCDSDINYGYFMSKAAMNMAARIVDNDMRKNGVRTLIFHPGRMKTKNMGGPHSNIFPGESAEGIIRIVESADFLPVEKIFMDYLGCELPW